MGTVEVDVVDRFLAAGSGGFDEWCRRPVDGADRAGRHRAELAFPLRRRACRERRICDVVRRSRRLRGAPQWPTAQGAVVEYTLTWSRHGVPHAGHHVHLLTIEHDRIVTDTVMCGGRWPASLLAEMEEAGG